MRLDTYIFHSLWSAASRSAEKRFHNACSKLRPAQTKTLRSILDSNKSTVFGVDHGFSECFTIDQYRSKIPLSKYEDYLPYLKRIEHQAAGILTEEPVSRFHLTSGSTSKNKQIPYTAGLRREFLNGIAPWIRSIYRRFPDIRGGRMYWVITPPPPPKLATADPGVLVSSAFDRDTEYLPSIARLGEKSLWCVPNSIESYTDAGHFLYRTAYYLLAAGDLRFISLWNASF